MRFLRPYWPVLLTCCLLAVLIILVTAPYRGNVTAFFHMDGEIPKHYDMPKNFVILQMPGYDGMEYYQIARNIPILFIPSRWHEIAPIPPGPYAYQRIALPVFAFVLALGQTALLPYTFLLIELLSIVISCILILRWKSNAKLYALALAFCPATMVGLHFSLAEPLTIALITTFLVREDRKQRIDVWNLLLLCLIVLCREVNILFVLTLIVFFGYKRRWRDSALLLIPLCVFIAWHSIIYAIFGQIPFLWSTDKKAFPFTAIIDLLLGRKGYNSLTLSSIALFLLFVLPVIIFTVKDLIKDIGQRKSLELLPTLLLVFLCVMLAMPDHIWGSITSIGRVITPVYPLFILYAAKTDTTVSRILAVLLLFLGLAAGFGLALIHHPYILS